MQSCLKPQIPCSNHEILVLFEHGFELTKPIWALICLHGFKRCGLNWAFCRCFCLRKGCVRLWRCGDLFVVRMFDTDAILFREKGYFNVKATYSVRFRLNSGKYARIRITQKSHVSFIALTFAGSLRRCWNTRPNRFLGTRQMLMHEKTCVIPIITFGLPA